MAKKAKETKEGQAAKAPKKAEAVAIPIKVVATNRRAYHDFHIDEKLEVGMVLRGTEVKSLRGGSVQMKDAYGLIKNNELFIIGLHISPYSHGTNDNHEPERARKLLAHAKEIAKLLGKTREKGLTLIPLQIYFKKGIAKLEMGLARGKKEFDKRHTQKEKDARREMDAAAKARK